MDEFRAVRLEALCLLGGYDINETTEEIKAKLQRFHLRQNAMLGSNPHDPQTP